MSADLKPGDLCEVIAMETMTPAEREWVGRECTVESGPMPHPHDLLPALFASVLGTPFSGRTIYKVRFASGDVCMAVREVLRKKQPPADIDVLSTAAPYSRTSWSEIEKLTGWQPVREGAGA